MTLVTLVLVYMLFSEAFQASAALQCYQCERMPCENRPVDCAPPADTCGTLTEVVEGRKNTLKGCITKEDCDAQKVHRKVTCCQTDLCNGAEGVKLSLLFMLVPLISSILFL